jgi:cell division protein FtsW (lipid II flippase)
MVNAPASSAAKDHVTLAQESISRGGLTGVGIGQGRATSKVPVVESDYITALVSEELGLIGILALFALIAAIPIRLLILAWAQPMYTRLILVGTAAWIAVQASVNLMMANGTLWPMGLPMPFVSQGGSSLVALWVMIGICQGSMIHSKNKKEVPSEASSSRRRNRRTHLSSA